MAPTEFKPVQEALLEGGKVPKRYMKVKYEHKDQVIDDNTPLPLVDEPLIDLSLLSSSFPQQLQKLHSALSSWGYVQVINHGMTREFLNEVRDIVKQFFGMSTEEKEKYFIKEKPGPTDAPLEGYGNDNAYKQKTLNWNDNMHLQLYPHTKLNFDLWPTKPLNFRTTLCEYTMKAKMIVDELLKALSRSLKLEEKRLFELWGNDEKDKILGRFNFYPRCPEADQVIGLKPHSDGSAFTILLQDKLFQGLQILKHDKWFQVPLIPEAVIFIVGDQMEIMSNGIFKSPVHQGIVNPEFDRISLAMFCVPNPEKEIGPLEELINKERPQLYKRLKDYAQLFFQSYPNKEEDRSIHLVKINFQGQISSN